MRDCEGMESCVLDDITSFVRSDLDETLRAECISDQSRLFI